MLSQLGAGARLEIDQEILGATSHADNALSYGRAQRRLVYRRAQSALTHFHAHDRAPQ